MKSDDSNFDISILSAKCNSNYNRIAKRVIGRILALPVLIVLFPLMLLISIIIFIESGMPIFYRANRGGTNGKPFKIYKFRTMVKNADSIGTGTTALNDDRITAFGKILRNTKIDEIPQLINIIKGEMCFIGPRPELLRYTENYDEIEKYILKVRPGITDFSSLEFISLDEIVGYDNPDEMYETYVLKRKNWLRLKYVANLSFWTDFKLFLRTIYGVMLKISRLILNGKKVVNGIHRT
jgi:lipopolysaccharide/colanic/teichoic acid biosynthesis glycosyltransferase